ncbi:MAG TPA: restriction endonuclease subunit S [Pyrinomonadaceae bacterium]|nr:restriction endonuclease subunit S [Pyrinomonadaceae bacterium]
MLPEGWQRVKFGDVVRNVDVAERNPLENGLERYVGLEHLDPESLHIKRWGLIEEGTSFTRKFVRGQVLFGKRRAYQRKAAVAKFDGICSGDILVFEPKGDDLIPELLPFIVQSDGFFEKALGTSAGSLSPRTKWKDLAAYEFALPPKDDQQRIADILWAADTLHEAREAVLRDLIAVHTVYLDRLFINGIGSARLKQTSVGKRPKHWRFGKVGDFLELQRGFDLTEKESREGHVPVVSSSGISYFHDTAMAQPPGVVTGRKGKLGDVFFLNTPYWPHDTSLWVKDFKGNEPRFIFWLLKFLRLEKLDAATAVPTLNRNNVHPLGVAIPPLDEQREIAKLLDSIVNTLKIAERDLESLKKLKRALAKTMLESHV